MGDVINLRDLILREIKNVNEKMEKGELAEAGDLIVHADWLYAGHLTIRL